MPVSIQQCASQAFMENREHLVIKFTFSGRLPCPCELNLQLSASPSGMSQRKTPRHCPAHPLRVDKCECVHRSTRTVRGIICYSLIETSLTRRVWRCPRDIHALGSSNLSDDPQSRKTSYTELSFKRHSLTLNINSHVYILHNMSGGVAEVQPIQWL